MSDSPVLKGFTIHRSIGRGGQGQVFEVTRDSRPEQVMAAKFLVGTGFEVEGMKDRFSRECAALSRLSHRAIVKILDFGVTEDGLPFLLMEHIEGRRLMDVAPELDAVQKASLIVEVLNGLSHTHSHDIIHRDVKPSNILVREADQQPVLVDFGHAYIWDSVSSDTRTQHLIGSQGYIPPEVIANFRHRSATHDVYSVCVTLYEILAGTRPVAGSVESLGKIDAGLIGLDHIIGKGLAAEAKRYSSADDFSFDLNRWIERQRPVVIGPMPELLDRMREHLLQQKQHAESLKRRQQLQAAGTDMALNAVEAAIDGAARHSLSLLADVIADINGEHWTVKEGRLGAPQRKLQSLVASDGKRSLDVIRVLDTASIQGLSGKPVIDWANSGRPVGPRLPRPVESPRPASRKRPLAWSWLIVAEGFSSSHKLLGGIGSFAASFDDTTGVPEVEVYGRPLIGGSPPERLDSGEDYARYLLRAAGQAFGIPP